MGLSASFWRGKRVLLTGHTGFKGSWLVLWLRRLGAEVSGIALQPDTTPSLFQLAQIKGECDHHNCDIRDASVFIALVRAFRPEIVLHLAAQPLVRASYRDPLGTFSSNIMGTAHLLEALRNLNSVRVAVMVTTDKVYRNNEWMYPYREHDALGGHDPYSASKAASEIVITSYRDAFLQEQGVAVAAARAGNVIGGGDWSEDRLIPDAVRAWQAGRTLEIRSPFAVRPWQHVLEPLFCYMMLAEKLWQQSELAGSYNFGPYSHEVSTVREVIELARQTYGRGAVHYSNENTGPHEAGRLTLEVAKAQAVLGIAPQWSLIEAIQRTMNWYRSQHQGMDARVLCEAEIAAYEARV